MTRPTLPTLRLGDMGPDVEKLQTQLQLHGYLDSGATGQFDDTTRLALIAFQKDKRLPGDGVCRANAWKALNGPVAVKPVVQTDAEFRAKILTMAIGEIGTAEDAANTNHGDILKYPQLFGRGSESYCADFASYVLTRAGGTMNIPSTKTLLAELKKQGTWKTSDPKPGDLILMDWQADGIPDHVGIVESVDDDGTVNTIEGNDVNENGQEGVYRHQRSADVILGYGSPF